MRILQNFGIRERTIYLAPQFIARSRRPVASDGGWQLQMEFGDGLVPLGIDGWATLCYSHSGYTNSSWTNHGEVS